MSKKLSLSALGLLFKIVVSHANVTENTMNPESSIDFGFVFESFPGVSYHFPAPPTILTMFLFMEFI